MLLNAPNWGIFEALFHAAIDASFRCIFSVYLYIAIKAPSSGFASALYALLNKLFSKALIAHFMDYC